MSESTSSNSYLVTSRKASGFTWSEALHEFLLHVQATRAHKTYYYYKVQLSGLTGWAEDNAIPFDHFGKRHLDCYLIERQNQGKAQLTLHHDAICTKKFFDWCSRNDLVERSLLADYQVRNAPTPPKHMPTDEEIRTLLGAMRDYWDKDKHPSVRYYDVKKRLFHRDRNFAIIIGLLDSACRIGEMFNLKVDDYCSGEKQITIRVSKGREPRILPVGPEWADALGDWLKIRARIMANVPKDEDEGWLFISEYGGRVHEGRFLAAIKSYLSWAELPATITLHSLRRYSLNRLAKHNLLMAQQIAGHKETKTTLLYTKIDADFVREQYRQVGVVRGVVSSKRPARKKLI